MDPTPTIFEYRLPPASINPLTANQKAGGVGEVDEASLGVKIQRPWIDQLLDRRHVLVRRLHVHVQAPDEPRSAFSVEQEQLAFELCEGNTNTTNMSTRRSYPICPSF